MGMKLKEIRDLIRLVDKTEIQEVEIEHEGTKLRLKKAVQEPGSAMQPIVQPPPQVASQVTWAPSQANDTPQQVEAPTPPATTQKEEDEQDLHQIVAPMVGTFYRAPAPDADPYVQEGDQVEESTVVCIIEAMKLMNEIEAEVKGTIVKILVENGQLVEYGQPLFLVKTT